MGFIVLAGLAMIIIAAIVLMPAWASTIRTEHKRDDRFAGDGHVRKIIDARNRCKDDLPHNVTLNERYFKGMIRQDPVHAPPLAHLPEPSGWALDLADKLARPKTRRGLFFVACVALAGAMFLFAPPAPQVVKPASRSRRET
ncbi:MAG: hypothetical protein GY794_26825 [bacterium]|nr:hypothetical protein [bacterium]